MSELVQLSRARRPEWLRVRIQRNESFDELTTLMRGLHLHSVCEEARCPNIWECWGQHRTATFMILGDICTRACRYCSVTHGRPQAPDPQEPAHVAAAVAELKLKHVVVTSVDRDDLPDFGAGHFVATIAAIRRAAPGCRVEVLIPDFYGDAQALATLLAARPEVLNHNTETVPRLFRRLRAKGDFKRSMTLLARADAYRHEHALPMTTKSGVMVGLGETQAELLLVMDELRRVRCDVLTLGQYLNPTHKHAPVAKFYTPDEFASLKEQALARGFAHVESGPLVRSSYHAHAHVPA